MDKKVLDEVNKTLNDSIKSYTDKIEALLFGWTGVYTILTRHPTESCETLMNYLHKKSLQYLLHGDYTQLDEDLRVKFTVVLHKLMALTKTDQEALRRCKLLIKLIYEPWNNAVLRKILHCQAPTDKEVLDFITSEGRDLLLMRIEVLCESKCEDLAYQLTSTILKLLTNHKDFKKSDVDYISDVLLMLLFRFKRHQEIIEKLRNLDLSEGLGVIKRFAGRKSNESGLWKNCDKFSELAAHTFLASIIVQDIDSKEKQSLFHELVNEWALLHVPKLTKSLTTLCNMVRKIIQKAESPVPAYVFAKVLHKQLGDQVKPLCIELYIRGFTTNINLIERFKSLHDCDKTLKAEMLLSDSFIELSELLDDNIIIHRECVLTAFSLNPTKECLQRLGHAASLRCENCKKEENLQKPESEKIHIWNNCDNISCVHAREKTEEHLIDAVNSLNILNSDLLGLAPHLCDDLSTVLCSPRCQTLSWSFGWDRLRSLCEKYLEEHCDRKTRSTELKYLNIDYSRFDNDSTKVNSGSSRKIKKHNINRSSPSDSPVFSNKEVSFKNFINNQKNEFDKNLLKHSIKINDYMKKPCTSEESSDESEVSQVAPLCQRTYGSVKKSHCKNFITEPYLTNSKRLNDSKYSTFLNSNEGSVLSCSNSSYNPLSSQSPKPAEVPPIALTKSLYQESLIPLLNSVLSCNSKLPSPETPRALNYNGPLSSDGKTDIGNGIRRVNIFSKTPTKLPRCSSVIPRTPSMLSTVPTILSMPSSKNDNLLTKYIPGMNSLDLIVPSRPEQTVQVVQIPSSGSVLQSSSNTSSVVQSSNPTISVAKPINESVSSHQPSENINTHTQTNAPAIQSNHDSSSNTNNSSLLLTTLVSPSSYSRLHSSDQRNTSIFTSVGTSCIQSKVSETVTSDVASINTEPSNSVLNVSTHEGSTQVTAHIQRIGQPNKQKLFDETSTIKTSNQNLNLHMPNSISVMEDPTKHTQQLYRFLLKDGKIIEQYQGGHTFSVPEMANDNSSQVSSHQDHIHYYNKNKKEVVKDEGCNTSTENIQTQGLPQFHQVFRRQVYQSGSIIENNSLPTPPSPRSFIDDSNDSQKPVNSPLSKAVQTVPTKCSDNIDEDSSISVSSNHSVAEMKDDVQMNDIPSSSGVIFTCKAPVSLSGTSVLQNKPVTILKSTTTNTPEVIARTLQKIDHEPNKVKDSVIRSNMNALLAAALQSNPIKGSSVDSSPVASHTLKQVKINPQDNKNEGSAAVSSKVRLPSPAKNARRQSLTNTNNNSRFIRPQAQSTSVNAMSQTPPPVVTIPHSSRSVPVLTPNLNQSPITNMTKIDNRTQSTPEQTSVSSTTLEQLREFESVLEQVTNTSQMKERGNAKKMESLAISTSSNSEFSCANASKVNSLFQTSLANAISELTNDNRVSLTFISKSSTTCTNTIISGSSPKMSTSTPVVVVQSCSRPLASPALSVASQSSPGSSPSTPPANAQAKMSPKLAKPKGKTIGGKSTPTATLKVSTLSKPQQKPQEDEQTTQRIYAILDKYAEQLRNSPELKNKPAPRRRSNPPTNPSQSSKRKKSSQGKCKSFSGIPSCSSLEMSPGSEDLRTAGSEDSSNGVSQVTQTGGSPHRSDELSSQGDVSSDAGEPSDRDQRLHHRILLTDQTGGAGRTVIVQDNMQPVISVEGAKVIAGKQLATVPLTLQLPGAGNVKQVLFPVPADGRPFVVAKVPKMYRFHQVAVPSGSPLIATNTSGTVVLRQMCLNKSNATLKQVKVPVVSQISTHPTVVLPTGSSSFTLSAGPSIESDSLGIALDNTILLNSPAPTSSIGFIQRNVSRTVHSPSIVQSHSVGTQESSNMSSSEITPTNKPEDVTIKCEESSVNNAVPQDMDYKKEESVKYNLSSIDSASETPPSSTAIISSPSATTTSWAQMLKDNCSTGTDVLIKVEENEMKKINKRDSSSNEKQNNDKSPDKQFCDGSKHSSGETLLKAELTDDNSYCIEGICIREPGEKAVDNATMDQVPLNQSQGLKRKVENTIFQIAFKQEPKSKVSKDEFVHQRNSTSAIERELRLQKSLSEECEDLGVDKPSTSDLFPEAELLLDPDPLSRDSLQGELFPRGESSSSCSSSSNNSPIFSNKNANVWKKQKKALINNLNCTEGLGTSKKDIPDKSEMPLECSSLIISNSPTTNVNFDVNKNNDNHEYKCSVPESITESDMQGADISMECNDSNPCNFSDVDDHPPRSILDSGGESDADFLQKTDDKKQSNASLDKPEPESEKPEQVKRRKYFFKSGNNLNNCRYYFNKDIEYRYRKIADNSEMNWYQVIKSNQKDESNPPDDRSTISSRGNNDSQNGLMLQEFEEEQRNLTLIVPNKKFEFRKRRNIGIFTTSPSEDSGSSVETSLPGSDSCSTDFHDCLAKRASSRGRVKKGCPCFNGSPEPSKKKKELSPLDKTEKPCSTNPSSAVVKKSTTKSNIKINNKKR